MSNECCFSHPVCGTFSIAAQQTETLEGQKLGFLGCTCRMPRSCHCGSHFRSYPARCLFDWFPQSLFWTPYLFNFSFLENSIVEAIFSPKFDSKAISFLRTVPLIKFQIWGKKLKITLSEHHARIEFSLNYFGGIDAQPKLGFASDKGLTTFGSISINPSIALLIREIFLPVS